MTRIIGILNITPDSFSDGGEWLEPEIALAHAKTMVTAGADLIDIGGESTRPGSSRVPVDVEQSRVIPIIKALVAEEISVSLDTMNAATAEQGIAAGIKIVNDVSGGLADEAMIPLIAAHPEVSYIVSHWRGHSDQMDALANYKDVVADVKAELSARIAECIAGGVNPNQIIIDPGLGFAKSSEHNWQLLARLPELKSLGYPVLVGASRKRFLAELCEPGHQVKARDLPTALISAMLASQNIWGLRVHEVAMTKTSLAVAGRMQSFEPKVDQITLSGLKASGNHGVFDFEKTTQQEFIVDLQIGVDHSQASKSDNLVDTVDYGLLAEKVLAVVTEQSFDLIEYLAARIADVCLSLDPIRSVAVTVHKPQAPIEATFEDVSVTVYRERPWQQAVIALGANLGSREANISLAAQKLSEQNSFSSIKLSRLFETPALKPDGIDYDSPSYLNAVLIAQTNLAPKILLRYLQQIELELGRERGELWADRTIDLDLISYGDYQSNEPELNLPHPRAHNRAFVLLPWLELDPMATLPGYGSVAELLGNCNDPVFPWRSDQ